MTGDVVVRTLPVMGTVATMQVLLDDPSSRAAAESATSAAADWLLEVERRCSRFVERSELRQLCATVGRPVHVSEFLFEPLRLALLLADETDGAFDPTVGAVQVARGFDREHRTGAPSGARGDAGATFRDVEISMGDRTVTLHRRLLLDLGAIAKGFAVDLAARELARWQNFAIDAGGDEWFAGVNADGMPWRVGVRHPARRDEVIEVLAVSNAAVCTSGGYETAETAGDGGHHIVDPRTRESPRATVSATVIGPSAMAADALATAALVIGGEEAIALLERHGARGVLYDASLARHATRDLAEANA